MKVYDISAPFSEKLPVYTGDPALTICDAKAGSLANVSTLAFGTHTGTHVDVPKHLIDGGKALSDFPAETFLGDSVVAEALGKPVILKEDVEGIPGDIGGKIVLFKTDNGDAMLEPAFRTKYVHMDPAAAKALTDRGVKGAGIDYLSVDEYGSTGFGSHMILLGNGLFILEGAVLTHVPPGEYFLSALPLNIPGGNGCPVRAVLIDF